MRLPKYEILRQYIIDIARKHENHEKPLPSEREMSKMFNVTRTSLRRALKELIEEGMLIARHGSGLYLSGISIDNVAASELVLPKILVLSAKGRSGFFDNWYMHVYSAVFRELSKYPVTLFPGFLVSEKEDMLHEIEMYNPDGIIWIRPDENRTPLLKALEQKYPVCSLLGIPDGKSLTVTVDYQSAGAAAAQYFYNRGCRNPLYVGAGGKEYSLPMIDLFFAGWKKEWKNLTGKFDQKNVISQNGDFKRFFHDRKNAKGDCIFCHSNVYYGFARDVAGSAFENCPIMTDSSFYIQPPYSMVKPSVQIELYPDKVFSIAVEKLLTALKEPDKKQTEIQIKPEIITKGK